MCDELDDMIATEKYLFDGPEDDDERVSDRADEMVGCPFCGCQIGVLELGGFQWFGNHKSCCPLEGNPSASWGRREDLVKDWNTRASNESK